MTAPSFMDLALKAAETAGKSGEVPIGCVIVRDNEVIAAAGNRTLTERDPTAHAEILAIRLAAEVIGSERLVDCDLYVTLEPCTMCTAAISFARVRRLYYGAADPHEDDRTSAARETDGHLGDDPRAGEKTAHVHRCGPPAVCHNAACRISACQNFAFRTCLRRRGRGANCDRRDQASRRRASATVLTHHDPAQTLCADHGPARREKISCRGISCPQSEMPEGLRRGRHAADDRQTADSAWDGRRF